MNNEMLFSRVKKLVATERRIGVEILECLSEIEHRRAYSELRYDGLFTYCVKELGFTDGQAYQRIQAMRALKEVPELKSKIEEGSLSVSAARTGGDAAELLKTLARDWVSRNDPELRKNQAAKLRRDVPWLIEKKLPVVKPTLDREDQKTTKDHKRAPSAQLRRLIWKRDSGKCTRCESRFALEVDHIHPHALGGATVADNLRLLCRSCNQYASMQFFGRYHRSKPSRSSVTSV